MTDFTSWANRLPGPDIPGVVRKPTLLDQKKTVVAAVSADKRAGLGLTPAEHYNITAAGAGGGGANFNNQLANDLRLLSPSALHLKYGEQAQGLISAQAEADAQYFRDRVSTRTTPQAIGDSALDVTGGLASTGTGIAALGAGIVSDRAGAAVSKFGNDITAGLQDLQSGGMKQHRTATAALDAVDAQDNQAQYEIDKATQGDLVAEIGRFTRGVKNSVSRQIDDGTMLTSGVANAAGSLAGSGAIMKGLSKIGAAALGAVNKAGDGMIRTAAIAEKYGEATNAAIAVGSMEAGGAYQQTMTQAMADLADRTDLTEEQKLEMAGNAAKTAALVQGGVGALTGQLVGAFERNPFKGGSFRGLAMNAGKETIEEGTQSATGQISQNYGLSRQVDPNIDIGQGAGEQAGVGGLYGFGSAIAAGGPGAVAAVPGRALRSIVGVAKRKTDAILNGVASESPVAPEQLDAFRAEMATRLDAGTADLHEAINSSTDLTPEVKATANDYVARLSGFMKFDPATLENQHPDVQAVVGTATDTTDALAKAAKMAGDETLDPAARIAAAQYLHDRFGEIQALKTEDNSVDVVEAAHKSGAVQNLLDIEKLIQGYATDPRINQAMVAAMELAKPVSPAAVETMTTPESQNAVTSTVAIAQQAMLTPTAETLAKVNPETASKILKHHDNGKVQLTPAQRAALVLSSALALSFQQSEADAAKAKVTGNRVISVSGDVRGKDRGKASTERRTVAEHSRIIMDAMTSGNTKKAAEYATYLMNFAQTYANKIAALNSSRATMEQDPNATFGPKVPYKSWHPEDKTWIDKYTAAWNPTTKESQNYLNSTMVDGRAVTMLANHIANGLSELGVKPIETPSYEGASVTPVQAKAEPTSDAQAEASAEVQSAATEVSTEAKASDKSKEKAKRTRKAKPKAEVKTEPVVEPTPAPETVAAVEPVAEPTVTPTVEPTQLEMSLPEPAPRNEARQTTEDKVVHDRLSKDDKKVLAAHYGERIYNAVAQAKFIGDIVNAINNGLSKVAEVIRAIVKRIIPSVLLASVVFNPLAVHAPAKGSIPSVTTFQTVQMVDVKTKVPVAARNAMSPLAIGVYESMASVAMAQGLGFFIADKPNGMIHVFGKDGKYIASSKALFGKATGDILTAESMAKSTDDMTDADRVTPSGTYRVQMQSHAGYTGGKGLVLHTVDGKSIGGVSIHAVYLGADVASEKRAERLASDTNTDNKISYGCMNTTNEFFLNKVLPNSEQLDGGMVFILPDAVEDTAKTFPATKVAVTTTTTTTKQIPAPVEPAGPNNEAILSDGRRTASASRRGDNKKDDNTDGKNPSTDAVKAPDQKAEAAPEAAQAQPESKSGVTLQQRTEEKKPVTAPILGKPAPLSETFPNLVGGAKNIFLKAFRLAANTTSRLANQDNPQHFVASFLRTAEDYTDLTGKEHLGVRLDTGIGTTYRQYVNEAYRLVKASMEAQLSEALLVKFDGVTLEDYMNAGNDAYRQIKNRALNVVDQTADGYQYNQKILDTAIMAALQWMVSNKLREKEMDIERIAQILKVSEENVPEDLRAAFEDGGMYLNDLTRDLGGQIARYLGVDEVSSAPTGHTKGIFTGLASELVRALIDNGMIGETKITYKNRNYNLGKFFPTKDQQSLAKDLLKFPNAIESIVFEEFDEPHIVGKPSTSMPKTQLRNSGAPITKQQQEVIAKVQQIPSYLNMPMIAFLSALGQDAVVQLFGHGDLDKRKLNANHKKALTSVNNTLVAALESVGRLIGRVSEEGGPAGEVPIYYEFDITKVNRLQTRGSYNPQANKLVREISLPTWETLDLSNENSKDSELFWLGIAQAWGVKVHKKPRAESIAEAQELAKGYTKSIELVQNWIGAGDLSKLGGLSEDAVATIAGELVPGGGPVSPLAFHALLEYARYKGATPEGRQAFRTALYVEADGVTDGPINAMLHLARGLFTPNWMRIMGKGGAFFGKAAMTLSKWGDQVDFYTVTKDFLETRLEKQHLGVRTESEKKKWAQLERVMARLIPSASMMTYEDGTTGLTFDRNIAKNPLTMAIYGAGLTGLTDRVWDMMQKEFYVLMSDIMERGVEDVFGSEANFLQFNADFRELTGQSINAFGIMTIEEKAAQRMKDTLGPLFVEHLQAAIEDSIGESASGRTAIRKAMQAQSIIAKAIETKLINQKLLEKEATAAKTGWKKGDFLSRDDLNEIKDKMKSLNLMIQTGTQNILPSNSEREVHGRTRFSETLAGTNEIMAFYNGTQDIGVGAIPTTIISTGDGQAVQNVITHPNAPKAAVYIYDGYNFGLKSLEDNSRVANEAVHQAWMENPFEAVARAYNNFLGNIDAFEMNDEAYNSLKWCFEEKGPDGKPIALSRTAVMARVRNLNDELKQISMEIQARKNVLARVAMSVDHLASAEAPFVSGGLIDLSGMELEDQAKALNLLFIEEYKKLQALDSTAAPLNVPAYALPKTDTFGDGPKRTLTTAPAPAPVRAPVAAATPAPVRVAPPAAARTVQAPVTSNDISGQLGEIGVLDSKHGVRIISHGDLTAVANTMNIPGNQKNLLKPLLASLVSRKVKVVHGTLEQVLDYANARGESDIRNVDGMTHGFYSTESETIYLINPSSETLVHELIHAATFGKLEAYYNNPSSLSNHERQAIQRIEALYTDWATKRDIAEAFEDNVEANSWEDYNSAITASNDYWNKGDKAAAINEFMAWVLSNQGLARAARDTKFENPIAKIASFLLDSLKRLLWGEKIAPNVGEDFYSNLRFNTEVLLRSDALSPSAKQHILFQSAAYGTSDRLVALKDAFYERIVKSEGLRRAMAPGAFTIHNYPSSAPFKSRVITNSFDAHGWSMTPQQQGAFQIMVMAFMSEAELDGNALVRMDEMYRHVIANLKADDFRKNTDFNDQADKHQADAKYNSLMGRYAKEFDEKGRSTLLPAFMALAAVHPEFQDVLTKMDLPKSEKVRGGTLDATLTNAGTKMMDNLARIMASEGRQPNVAAAIERLTDELAQIGQWQQSYTDKANSLMAPAGRLSDKANEFVVEGMQTGSRKLIDKLKNFQNTSTNEHLKKAAAIAQALTSVINIDESKIAAEGVMEFIDTKDNLRPLRDMMAEIMGRTLDNASVYDMIKTVRAAIKAVRQQYREQLPKIIGEKFTRKLDAREWTHQFKGLAKTDLGALVGALSPAQILEMMTKPNVFRAHTNNVEARVRLAYGTNWPVLEQKARELAHFMNTGVVPNNLLKNAAAVANLWTESHRVTGLQVTDAMVNDVDQLISLYAFADLDLETKAGLKELAQNEPEALKYVLSYVVRLRADELAKLDSDFAKANHYKGFVPSPPSGGRSLIVANDAEYADLIQRGYTRIGDYATSDAERFPETRGYYYASVSARSPFEEGVMQTTRMTASGIDPQTGFSMDTMTAGRIESPNEVARLQRILRRGGVTGQALIPVFSDIGKVIAYERSVDPTETERLERNTDLSKILGIWRGRQEEERLSGSVNVMLVDRLNEDWQKAVQDGKQDQFVNVMTSPDPVTQDSLKLMPVSMREDIESRFGENTLMVRRSMVNNTLGYRSASIGDAWTGNTRWSESTQDAVVALATSVFNVKAYSKLVKAESIWHNVVSDAKVTIVVKSVIVPAANLIANVVQLVARGVPLAHVLGNIPKKTAEVNAYVNGRIRRMKYEADLHAATGDLIETRRLTNLIQAIDDGFRRLTIWPLIAAGEFAAISDVGIGQEEIDLVSGRLTQYVESMMSKLPDGVKTVGRYAIVGKDTALFQGLQRAMEYGDFLGKAVLYEDMTTRLKKSHKEAMAAVTEEYNNYDWLPGRFRSAMDRIGLMWFWSYKLRSLKVALSMVRNNPFHALMANLIPLPTTFGDIGSPLDSNIVSLAANGTLDNSVGIGMGLRAHQLNPVLNILGI